ncbi:MAG: class I SAM-dependent methyltransferase [Acidimicrobiales bacterium]
MAAEPIDYLGGNVAAWQARQTDQLTTGRRLWAADEPCWGIFAVPETRTRILPQSVVGLDALELGCGTAYVSAWLARAGARPVGLDPTPGQLSNARQLQHEFDLSFPLVRAAAEHVPLRSASFDLVISEYGAVIWSDPYRWIPEASRLLRPGGELVLLGTSTLLTACVPDVDGLPAGRELLRPQLGMHRFEWPGDPTVEFHLSHGDWIKLFRQHGLDVEDLIEVYAPEGATTRYDFVTAGWASRWPHEEVWRVRKH